VESFVTRFCQQNRRPVKPVGPEAMALLTRYPWPGNVRELENAIERAVLVAKGQEITVGDLPESVREGGGGDAAFTIPPHRTLAEIEKTAIEQTLERTNGNKQEAAHILGLYRPTLYSKMRKHGIAGAGRHGATTGTSRLGRSRAT
jgi:DNA-binding NtrC family response regulator